jgi:hypothetical protein
MKETFIDPLLHPFSATPSLPLPSSPSPVIDYDYYRTDSPGGAGESAEDLPPIAARFMSPTPSLPASARRATETPNIDDSMTEDDDEEPARPHSSKRSAASHEASKHTHPRSPYRSTAARASRTGTTVPFPSRSHHSLPPPARNQAAASTQSLGKQSTIVERERKQSETTPQKSGVLRKFRKSQATPASILGDSAIPPHQLPDDLRICLEVIDGGVFDGHKRLSEALKRRYDDQYPLVRSLADVFVSNVSSFTLFFFFFFFFFFLKL